MPRIINAYDGNSAIGDSLSKLGEAIYGDQAKNEVYRQKAFGAKRENDNIPLLADAVAAGDKNAIAKFGVMSNKTGQDTGDFNRLGVSNHATGVDDPNLALATMGAGGAFTSTAPGQGRALQNNITTTGMNNASAERIGEGNNATSLEVGVGNNDTSRDVAHIQADKTAQSDKYKFDNTYENTYDPATGRTVLTPRSQAAGREVAPTKDSVVGGMLRRVADGQQPGTPGQTDVGPAANPFAALSPQVQHVAGVGMPEQSLIEPRSGMTGISRDGGQTVTLPNGVTIPATGFQPVGQDAALGQARDNNVRAGAAKPLVVANPAASQAAADASNSSGLGPKAATILNNELGALPGVPTALKAGFGSSQIAPGVQDARQTQDIRNNQARSVLLGAPGRQTMQAQKWVNELLPQGDAFANPATEAAKIPKIVGALKGDYDQLQAVATDPNTLPADRVKVTQQMRQIENTIRMYTEPTAPTAGAPPAPAAAAAPTAPAQGGDPISQARAAIAQGANPAAVKARLQQNGIDPAGL